MFSLCSLEQGPDPPECLPISPCRVLAKHHLRTGLLVTVDLNYSGGKIVAYFFGFNFSALIIYLQDPSLRLFLNVCIAKDDF